MANHPNRGLHLAEIAAMLATEAHFIQSSKDLRPACYAVPEPHLIAKDAAALLRIGNGVASRAVLQCNGIQHWDPQTRQMQSTWTEEDETHNDKMKERARTKAQSIADRYGAKVETGGDPRGCTLRLHLASGRHNTMGGRESGWGIA